MVDRQDIDALLISALYGELTPADEARLQSHLDSHPADKTALADLTFARNAVRESRILTVQLDPPQSVSALLLQEAARCAPVAKSEPKQPPWFQRFVQSFAAHPAMAAAAMLVLVLGVAGMVYLRGDSYVEPHVASESTVAPVQPAHLSQEPETAVDRDSKQLMDKAGSAYEATFNGRENADDAREPAKHKQAGERAKRATYIASDPAPQPQPQDLDERQSKIEAKEPLASGGKDAVVDSQRPRAETRNAPGIVEPSPPPPAPSRQAPSVPTATVSRGAAGNDETVEIDAEETWAKEIHTKVVAAVRAKNCKDATALAVSLSTRAPGYYNSHVENDRALKDCATYINAEHERQLERVQRVRATQRRAEEPAAKPRPADKAAADKANTKR